MNPFDKRGPPQGPLAQVDYACLSPGYRRIHGNCRRRCWYAILYRSGATPYLIVELKDGKAHGGRCICSSSVGALMPWLHFQDQISIPLGTCEFSFISNRAFFAMSCRMARRTRQVKMFDMLPLHNNKHVSCITTIPGFVRYIQHSFPTYIIHISAGL